MTMDKPFAITPDAGISPAERFPGDEAIRRGWQLSPGGPTPRAPREMPVAAAPAGKRVLVAGTGPSGPHGACHLTRLGHSVTVKDAGARPGGMMRYGLPACRLPHDILHAEISRVLAWAPRSRPWPVRDRRPVRRYRDVA